MPRACFSLLLFVQLVLLAGCESEIAESAVITRTGFIQNKHLIEASGMQAARLREGVYFSHNDDGKAEIFAMDAYGANLGSFRIKGADNRDWEDMTWAPSEYGPLLVIGDTGDNHAQYKSITLYFVAEPEPGENGRYSDAQKVIHSIKLKYPDGARDCESIAYDPISSRIYLLTKKDKPARIYSIALDEALSEKMAVLHFDGEAARFRPPTLGDASVFGRKESRWVSQATGMDFSPDGLTAAVITYRSLYLFRRQQGKNWPAAFAHKPVEFPGPASKQEEALAYSPDGMEIIITSEGYRAPVYRFRTVPGED